MSKPCLKIVQLTTDNREPFREYDRPVPWFGAAPEALLQGLAEIPEAEVHVISCTQRPMRSPEKLAANIWFHSLHVPKIGWMRTAYQGCIRAVRRKITEIKPDIVHGQGTERDCSLGAVFSGFPNVLTIHGNMRLVAEVNRARPFSFEWLAARLEGFTLPRTGGVVCISNYTREAVAPLARRTWVVPNAVDQTFFDLRAKGGSGNPLVLCVGNICRRKNQNFFIRALDALAKTESFQVLFLGRASRTDAYGAEFFDLLEARPWCAYGGFADRQTVKHYFQQAALLVLPSLEDNCPMAVLEAMAAGVPVIAARVGGVPDLIEEGVTGFFCEPTNAEEMRESVRKCLTDADATRSIAERAHQAALDRFHPQSVARCHLQIYREVVGMGRSS